MPKGMPRFGGHNGERDRVKWIAPAAFTAVLFMGMVQARTSVSPAVRKLIKPSRE